MNPSEASTKTRVKVGLFSVAGLAMIGLFTVYVNDRPHWWRPCQMVEIDVEDATGLKEKSPIRSLGLEIGFLRSIALTENHVKLGICITAKIDVLPETRAFIRGEGFLGDKFVELKPVRYRGEIDPIFKNPSKAIAPAPVVPQPVESSAESSGENHGDLPASATRGHQRKPGSYPIQVINPSASLGRTILQLNPFSVPLAEAEEPVVAATSKSAPKRVPVAKNQQDMDNVVKQVDELVGEMKGLTTNLKEAINPQQLKATLQQLNKTLDSAARTLSPEGGLTTTAQRTLAKLEDAIEQFRDQMARVNRGEGSVGKLLNDPVYADEIRDAIRNVNRLLGRVSAIRFEVNLSAESIPVWDGTRGNFLLGIWPEEDRYYLLGVSFDPRGKKTVVTTTTTVGGVSTVAKTDTVEQSGLLFTATLGKVFWRRIDLSAGLINGDGGVSLGLWAGPNGFEDRFRIKGDLYSAGTGEGVDLRLYGYLQPGPKGSILQGVYFRGGMDGMKKVNGRIPYFFGAGLTFDDQDIKLLFAFK